MVNTKFEKFVWELCPWIDSEPKLINLGNALGIRRHIINGIKYNKDRDGLASAANEVLHKWLSRQSDTDEATLINKLREAFKTAELKQEFATVLEEIYGKQQTPRVTDRPAQGNPVLNAPMPQGDDDDQVDLL